MKTRLGKEARIPLVLLATLTIGACANVGPPVLERAVLGYDETDAKLSQKLLLLNIARWRAGEIPTSPLPRVSLQLLTGLQAPALAVK